MHKNFIKQLIFAQDLVNVFSNYAINLDNYFKDENNQKEHLELYNYYQKLMVDIKNLKDGLNK